ncbi:tRNA lysidine(34) synthetase TilS [Aquisphaera insulae]|uniref:tRNA lysidine(34) synthetase TilS n=1 Tax=Aquisphaera insulae TaxID=2712864 RepID=UPI0013ECB2E8|nr:tRNA lysidine(34) synthetase TilS [Aquisphaera insulae]
MHADSGRPALIPPWFNRVRLRIARRWPDLLGRPWIVAVSGGGDSVGLLLALHAIAPSLDLRLSVAHLDHGVRGEEADADAAFVAELATGLGLPVDLGHWQPSRGGHFEADARRARLAWLLEVARGRGACAVVLGHTADDQAETILHRILRGTGLRGLAGIPARRPMADDPPVALIRPMLAISRSEIRSSLAALGQPYREDATNADTARTRSRIRLDLIPHLAGRYNPRVAEAIGRLGRLAAGSQRVLEFCLDSLDRETLLAASPDRVELDRARLAALPPPLRIELLRRAWRRAGWPEVGMGARRWRRLGRLASRPASPAHDIGHGIRICVSGNIVLERLQRGNEDPEEPSRPLPVPGSVIWRGRTILASTDPDEPRDEAVDLDRIAPPLEVRGPCPGDRFEPLGMGGRTMPLADFLRGRKVPRGDRAAVPLLCDSAGILWVVGHRIADRVRVADGTTRILGLRAGLWAP